MHQTIYIIDFGSQYTQLIARRVRELNVYCEIHPYNHLPVLNDRVKGIILSGGPASVRDANAPVIDLSQYRLKYPVLGICYGAQLLAQQSGGTVEPSAMREYGRAQLSISETSNELLKGLDPLSQVWMSHADTINKPPLNFNITASTVDVKCAAYQVADEQTYGIQFHPEVVHTLEGKKLLTNFIYTICKCSGDWTPGLFIEETVAALRKQLGNDQVLLGLSGGVDSGVAASPRLAVYIWRGARHSSRASVASSATLA